MSDVAVSVKPESSPVRVDFAQTLRDHLLIYGWILGLARQVARAEIRYGNLVIDLKPLAVPVPRPDVTQHFASHCDVNDHQHGFYLAAALPVAGIRPGYLRLAVTNSRGESSDSVWPVTSGDASPGSLVQQHRATIDWLLQNLNSTDAALLREIAVPSGAPEKAEGSGLLRMDMPLRVDVCCLLEQRILVLMGELDEQDLPLTMARVMLGDTPFSCLKGLTFARRQNEAAAQALRGVSAARQSFAWVGAIQPAGSVEGAVIEFGAGMRQGRVRRTLGPGAQSELRLALDALEPNAAIDVLDRVAAQAGEVPPSSAFATWLAEALAAAVARLPSVLDNRQPHLLLHCDRVVPIADAGVYITGWMYADDGAVRTISCHHGFKRWRVDDRWMRDARSDVTAHLMTLGAAGAEGDHGFVCYVPLVNSGASYFLSVTSARGATHRVRLPSVDASAHPLQSIRTVLTSFAPSHRALRSLLDEQVGPAVSTAWSRRRRPSISKNSQRFGSAMVKPDLSVIVPLFGRHDLAEYQLAAFADDPDFQSLELIYFVDDPSLYDAFRSQCHDLFEVYRVPFTLAFAGINLGFAAANNCAATIASGRHLLLLNSDVMPKRRGWVAEMLKLYAGLKSPGWLGVKLLYEDGSVQHAGMTFRRHAPWNDLWINDHPHKGQSAVGLNGLRRVDAVTAACALVDADLYRELGGLSEDYIIGDFEDSDFCLRAAAAGRQHWVTLDIELYHLERQSQARIGDAQWRTNLTLYNCWLHQQRWGAHLEKHAQ